MSLTPDEELEYLSPDFDPATLTVAKLRGILVFHEIGYPSSAKKPQLIELFNENIVPQARRILGSRSRIKRTSKGITDVESSQGSTVGDDERVSMPPPTAARKRSAKPERASTEEDPTLPSTNARSSKKATSKHGRSSDTEPGAELEPKRPTVRKTRKSVTPGTVKVEEAEPPQALPPRDYRADQGVFSRDNPFQSGSSPLSGDGGERRRKSSGPTGKDPSRRKSSTNRRKTEHADRLPKVEDGVSVPTLSQFDVRSPRVGSSHNFGGDADDISAGEEFTPDEQLSLTHAQLHDSAQSLVPANRRRRGASPLLKTAPLAILSVLLSAYALLYRQEKIAIGYCHLPRSSSTPPTPLTGLDFPDVVSFLEPKCEPCPPHARCYPNFVLQCDPDFVLQAHPLALGGLVPLPSTCEPDGEKVRKVKAVADRAIHELRETRANYECGAVTAEGKVAASTPQVDEATLKETVGRKRRRGMSEAEFEELWAGAIGEILGRDEVEVVSDTAVDASVLGALRGNHTSAAVPARLLASTSLAALPLVCSLRRSVLAALGQYRLPLSVVVLVAVAALYLRGRLASQRRLAARIPHLVALSLERLADQAARAGDHGEKGVLAAQLRDDLLRDEWDVARREALWGRVRDVVERNANVRASRREVGGGEVGRVWEWIGAVDFLALGGEDRRASGGRGVSFGGRTSVGGGGAEEMVQTKGGWAESRPIY